MQNQNIIKVSVLDYNNRLITDAEVNISTKQVSSALAFDEYSNAYTSEKFKADRYTMTVSATGFEKQTRSTYIGASGTDQLFILGKKGMPFYYRDVVKVPLEPINDLFGVVVQAGEESKMPESVSSFAKQYKLEQLKTHDNYFKNGLFVYFYPKQISEAEKKRMLTDIQKQKGVITAGPLVIQAEKNASLFTGEIVVRFKGGVEEKEVKRLAKQFGLQILRAIPYAGNAYQFKVEAGNSYESLSVCEKLVETGLVEYAEPNLFHTSEDDAITPTNFLFPEQWDHPIINTPDAWQVLNDNLGVAQRFGSPDVVVAVVDSGVNTNHLQFNGSVSGGQPKVFSAFDFSNMVANNNTLGGSHGSCCAGASVGFTNTSSVTGGVPDGTVGIAGNCRLLAIRRGGTEADFSDMYIWAGGFNPNSVRPGFPAPLARGADVISNSFGFSVNVPISGLMRDTFDHLTSYGRNGKGILLFFSAGNDTVNLDTTFRRPWGMYKKCISVAAATLANDGATETKAVYSNFGTAISFCAPSSDSTQHNPPNLYGAWTATILNNVFGNDGEVPRNREGQTTLSAAAVTGASSINVGSTAGMVNGQAIFIGNPSINISPSEAKSITAIAGNTISFAPTLFSNKANGMAVLFGNRDYTSTFGGTSYATPVCAGVAALMLSANSSLTWVEVREILRETAIKIDPNNTDATGRWRDTANRISSDAGYTGPFFSQFYGYGRIDASAAVATAQTSTANRDIVVRDNMLDTGAGPSSVPHWHGVDIWVRNNNDGVAPASYATDANTAHQAPIAGQSNWLSVRFRNRGTTNSYPFFLRAYITHYASTEFIYPGNFIPTVRPNGAIPNPLAPGTYLIAEQLVNPVAATADGVVTMEWPLNLIPPATVVVGSVTVNWHPCLLVEVSPHDGFVPTGNHVWDNNNLAQKNLSIIYPDSVSDNASLVMLGNTLKARLENLRFVIFPKPRIKIPYFIYFPDLKINKAFQAYAKKYLPESSIGRYKEAEVVWINTSKKISFRLPEGGLIPLIIGLGKQQKIKEKFEIIVLQYAGKKITGSCGIEFRVEE